MKSFKRKVTPRPQLADQNTPISPSLSDVEEAQHGHLVLRAFYKQLSSRLTKNISTHELTPPSPRVTPAPQHQSVALIALKEALLGLGLAASELPAPGSGMKFVSDLFLTSLGNIQETPEMTAALQKLADIIQSMRDFLRKTSAKASCSPAQTETDSRLVHDMQQRLVTLTSDVHAAVTQGRHVAFFSMADGRSAIFSHVMQLEVILGAISDDAGATSPMRYYRVEETHLMRKAVYAQGISMPMTREFKNLVAAPGGSGGRAQEGGTGGEGGGFTITLDAAQTYRFDGLQTGAGGDGGEGTMKGGIGGSAGWFKIG